MSLNSDHDLTSSFVLFCRRLCVELCGRLCAMNYNGTALNHFWMSDKILRKYLPKKSFPIQYFKTEAKTKSCNLKADSQILWFAELITNLCSFEMQNILKIANRFSWMLIMVAIRMQLINYRAIELDSVVGTNKFTFYWIRTNVEHFSELDKNHISSLKVGFCWW